MAQQEDRTEPADQIPPNDTTVLDALIAKELAGHEDADFSWGKWYCECGVRLRRGLIEHVAHQKDVEQKLRIEATRG
ncbi:hypothetical protein SAMN04487912_102322 [Arthrobacter sp. cf158]|uniref:hypothetical protein n=1 Tax=Arthrobacter sp. cf158 TaxID=1761744 RepID=UPI0008982E99|nr:hypothetical protein [Arthrobacter sp. cf158]SDW32337.1 hypothetical protein SAMN04487912_102322 [Arthrobacter sp. cf158]